MNHDDPWAISTNAYSKYPLSIYSVHFSYFFFYLNTWTQSYTSSGLKRTQQTPETFILHIWDSLWIVSVQNPPLIFLLKQPVSRSMSFPCRSDQGAVTPGCPDRRAGSWRGPRGGCRCPWWRASAAVLSASSPAWGDALPSDRYVVVQALAPVWCTQWPGKRVNISYSQSDKRKKMEVVVVLL